MRRKSLIPMIVLLSGLLLFGVVQATEQKYCPLCSMNLKMFWKTSHWLTFSDKTTTGYCSIHCASMVYEKRTGQIDRWEVADYDTKSLTNAYEAHFLIGSDLPGTMTPVSKLAFASLETAQTYQKKHGGTLTDFDGALKAAIEGRGEDMAMLKKKVAAMSAVGKDLAGKQGCYKCHGDGGAGGEAIAWNSKEFADKMGDKVKIKESIMGGSHKMEGYQGKINEKELHAITLSVWSQRAK